jgi:VCBS repeat-containing protein
LFTYHATNGTLDSNPATVIITVNEGNPAPAASDDAYSVDESNVLTVAAPGVLANDTDADVDLLTATVVNGPGHGTLTLGGDGSVTYTPAAGFHGSDSFTYTASDGIATSNEATVTITVNSTNSQPVAANDAYDIAVDDVLVVNAATGVIVNDTDADLDTLMATLVDDAAHGTLALHADGSFDYTPDAGFHGTDSFTYTVYDGEATSTTATVTVNVNSLAVAVNDAYQTDQDTVLTLDAAGGVLDNDTDANSDPLTAAVVDGPAHGTLALQADGSLAYTPATGFTGTDAFTYVAKDGFGDSAAATVTLTVNPVAPAVMAQLRLEAGDSTGTPIATIAAGEQFVVSVYARDLRTDPQGVAAAYLDLLYDSSLVAIAGPITYGPDYASGQSGQAATDGLLDEAGASMAGSTPVGGDERLLFRVPFTANAAGSAQFHAEPADTSPEHDTHVLGDAAALLPAQVTLLNTTLTITSSAKGQAPASYADLADQAMASGEDWLAPE